MSVRNDNTRWVARYLLMLIPLLAFVIVMLVSDVRRGDWSGPIFVTAVMAGLFAFL